MESTLKQSTQDGLPILVSPLWTTAIRRRNEGNTEVNIRLRRSHIVYIEHNPHASLVKRKLQVWMHVHQFVTWMAIYIYPLVADFKLLRCFKIRPFRARIWCTHVCTFWSFLWLRTAAKNLSQPVVMIQEYCVLRLCLVKVSPDTLTWS